MVKNLVKAASFHFKNSFWEWKEDSVSEMNVGTGPPVHFGRCGWQLDGDCWWLCSCRALTQGWFLGFFLALAEECGSRVSQCHDTGPLQKRKLLNLDRKLELEYTGASGWRWAGECLRFSYLLLHEKVDDPSLYLSSGIMTQVPLTSLLLVSAAAREIGYFTKSSINEAIKCMTASSSQCPEHKLLLLFDKEKFYSINQRLLLTRELLTAEKNNWEKKNS